MTEWYKAQKVSKELHDLLLFMENCNLHILYFYKRNLQKKHSSISTDHFRGTGDGVGRKELRRGWKSPFGSTWLGWSCYKMKGKFPNFREGVDFVFVVNSHKPLFICLTHTAYVLPIFNYERVGLLHQIHRTEIMAYSEQKFIEKEDGWLGNEIGDIFSFYRLNTCSLRWEHQIVI